MRHRIRQDDGAVLIISALAMVALFLIVAIVIDLGATRSDRREGQLAVDSAASAAALGLAEGDAVQGCQDAIAYLNLTLGTSFNSSDCSPTFSSICSSSTPNSTPPQTSGDFTVVLHHPVVDPSVDQSSLLRRTSTINASDFGATTPADGSGCQRFGVQVTSTGSSYFGGIAGESQRSSRAHAVARVIPSTLGVDIPAFLMLERVDCGALVDQETNQGITVSASADGTEPGLIHSDSFATGACGGVNKNFAIHGGSLPSGLPSIKALPSTVEPTEPGQIRAAAQNGKHAGVYPGGLNVEPSGGASVFSRAPVDTKYGAGIAAMHTAAWDAVRAPAPPAGYPAPTPSCSIPPGQSLVWLTCASFTAGAIYPDVTEIYFTGDVTLGNTELNFPNARKVVIKGELSMGNTGAAFFPKVEELYVGRGVTGTGGGKRLGVNSATETSCPVIGLVPTRFVVFGGSPAFNVNRAALCWTTLYLAGPQIRPDGSPNDAYTRQESNSTAIHPSCATLLCPKIVGNQAPDADYNLTGGNTVLWSAPNQHVGELPEAVEQGIEDLAFITESSGTSDMANSTELKVSGVMYAPNSTINVRSPVSALPTNAQFIARKLKLFQGGLHMQPAPSDSVTVPSTGGISLIR